MEIFLGRRASLLGIMLSSLIVSIFSQNKNIRKLGVAISLSLILLMVALLITPVGREMLIREDKVELLAQGKYAESGSFGMRLYIWPIYLKKALEDPFSGTGIGRKAQKLALAQTNELTLRLEHAHNLFLNLWL
jgi:O-antigen ligase